MVINESISISRSPESIWSYWMDVANDVLWRDGIIKAIWTSKPPYGIGSTGEHMHKNMGGTMRKGVRGDLQKLKELMEKQNTNA